jgi:hypothetical protein
VSGLREASSSIDLDSIKLIETRVRMNRHARTLRSKKVKLSLYTPVTGPEGSRRLRLLKMVGLSILRIGRLYLLDIHVFLGLVSVRG